jgi:hypothetical protein
MKTLAVTSYALQLKTTKWCLSSSHSCYTFLLLIYHYDFISMNFPYLGENVSAINKIKKELIHRC